MKRVWVTGKFSNVQNKFVAALTVKGGKKYLAVGGKLREVIRIVDYVYIINPIEDK